LILVDGAAIKPNNRRPLRRLLIGDHFSMKKLVLFLLFGLTIFASGASAQGPSKNIIFSVSLTINDPKLGTFSTRELIVQPYPGGFAPVATPFGDVSFEMDFINGWITVSIINFRGEGCTGGNVTGRWPLRYLASRWIAVNGISGPTCDGEVTGQFEVDGPDGPNDLLQKNIAGNPGGIRIFRGDLQMIQKVTFGLVISYGDEIHTDGTVSTGFGPNNTSDSTVSHIVTPNSGLIYRQIPYVLYGKILWTAFCQTSKYLLISGAGLVLQAVCLGASAFQAILVIPAAAASFMKGKATAEGAATITMESGTVDITDYLGNTTRLNAGKTFEYSPPHPSLVAAVAPASRSIRVPATATAFATILNLGPGIASACRIGPESSQGLPIKLDYQTTDPKTNAITGQPNIPVDIPAPSQGQFTAQTFVFSITPTAAFTATDIRLSYTCNTSDTVTTLTGINTLLLSASNDPVPDHIAVGLTPSNDGIVRIPGTAGTNVFVIASTNIGIPSATTARVRLSDSTMPVTALVCETNPSDGQCKQTAGPTVTRTIANNENTTWTAFLKANGQLALDPAKYRVFFEFLDSAGVIRGSTSAAVMVQ
jgi:hypothetical protein